MTINPKLIKVLEYVANNEEDKVRDLLHQVFIEKARAIHEELMSMDDELDDDDQQDESMDETVGGSGDMGEDLTNEIEAMEDEIEFEETMSEDEEGSEEGSEDAADVVDALKEPIDAVMAAIAELRAQFEKQEANVSDESDEGDEEDVEDAEDVDMGSDGEVSVDVEDEEEMKTEEWTLDEEFDELAESLELEVVERSMEKSQKTAKDVGAASSGMSTGDNAVSPLPKSQASRMGAGPVDVTKGGQHSGYNHEAAPKAGDMGLGDNRRKKSTDKMSKVSKDGDSSALINKATSDGFGAINNTSPLTKGGQNLK